MGTLELVYCAAVFDYNVHISYIAPSCRLCAVSQHTEGVSSCSWMPAGSECRKIFKSLQLPVFHSLS